MQNLPSEVGPPAGLYRYVFSNDQLELLKNQIQRYKMLNAKMDAFIKEKQKETEALNRARTQAAIAAQVKARTESQEAARDKTNVSIPPLPPASKISDEYTMYPIPLSELFSMYFKNEKDVVFIKSGMTNTSQNSNENQQVQHGMFFNDVNRNLSSKPFPSLTTILGSSLRQDYPIPVLDGPLIARQAFEETIHSLSEQVKNYQDIVTAGTNAYGSNQESEKYNSKILLLKTLVRQAEYRQQVLNKTEEELTYQTGKKSLSIDPSSRVRTRRSIKKEGRSQDRDELKRLAEQAEFRRKKYQSYLKAIVSYREDFVKFHRQRKIESARAAKNVRSCVELISSRAEREGDKAEKKRLAALRANDMDAYSKLVEETKNERLKYLLAQTDNYIREITVKINYQRKLIQQDYSIDGGDHERINYSNKSSDREEQISFDYFSNAHNKFEEVRQPDLLRGGSLKEYQIQGLQWMVSLYNNNLNGILADEMGLGKTIQTIALLSYIMEVKKNLGPFLVVVPLTTLSNWVVEFLKWAPDIITVAYNGTQQTRKDIYTTEMESGQYNCVITTYEYIMKDKAILRKPFWQYIIVDEGHRMKNAQSKFSQILGSQYQSRSRLLLTGTPLQNNLPELWALLNFLLPNIFNCMDTFDQWFNQPFASFRGGSGGSTNVQSSSSDSQELLEISAEERMLVINRLHQLLRPFMLRRVKASVMGQLPDKVEKVIRCELSGWQKFLYKQIQTEGAVAINPHGEGNGAGTRGLSNIFMQLRKVCNHPYLFYSDTWPTNIDLIRSSGKFELLDRMLPKLKAQGHRVLMFSQMTQAMDILEDFFCFRGYRYLRLDGSTSSEEREQRTDQFNAPDSPYFIFILSTRAGGLGLNLATADTVIIFDSDWNPMMDAQAQDRAHRIGQKNEVRVFRLITCSPIEERILSRASDKLNNIGLVVEAGKFNKDSKASERKQMLEALLREMDDQDGAQSEDNGIPDDDQINEMMAHNPEEIEVYARMDKERLALEEQWAREAGLKRWKRLMMANERPAWLQHTANAAQHNTSRPLSAQETGDSSLGDARKVGRKVKRVDYRDSMTDSQFDRMIEHGYEPGTMNETTSIYSSADHGMKGKRKNCHRGEPNGHKRGKGSRSGPQSSLTSSQGGLSEATFSKLNEINTDMHDARALDGHLLMEYFMVKPRKNEFFGYYDIIKKPMDFKTINSRVRSRQYKSVLEFEDDWMLIFNNARTYNADDSIVYQDACALEERLKDHMVEFSHWKQSVGSPLKQLSATESTQEAASPVRHIELRERKNSFAEYDMSSFEEDNEDDYTDSYQIKDRKIPISPLSSSESFKPRHHRKGGR